MVKYFGMFEKFNPQGIHMWNIKPPGPKVIKLEYSLKLKIKRNDWLLVHKQPIAALYFKFENELKLYNLRARSTHIHTI